MIIKDISREIPKMKEGHPHLATVSSAYIVDNCYRVLIAETGKYHHIRIRRLDNQPISDFVVFQKIKNEFLGDEVEAVQVFPKVSNYVDNSNTYHLFSWKEISVPNLKEMYIYEN